MATLLLQSFQAEKAVAAPVQLLRPAQVAKTLAVSRSTIYRWFWEGVLQGVKMNGGTLRILSSSVEEKLNEVA